MLTSPQQRLQGGEEEAGAKRGEACDVLAAEYQRLRRELGLQGQPTQAWRPTSASAAWHGSKRLARTKAGCATLPQSPRMRSTARPLSQRQQAHEQEAHLKAKGLQSGLQHLRQEESAEGGIKAMGARAYQAEVLAACAMSEAETQARIHETHMESLCAYLREIKQAAETGAMEATEARRPAAEAAKRRQEPREHSARTEEDEEGQCHTHHDVPDGLAAPRKDSDDQSGYQHALCRASATESAQRMAGEALNAIRAMADRRTAQMELLHAELQFADRECSRACDDANMLLTQMGELNIAAEAAQGAMAAADARAESLMQERDALLQRIAALEAELQRAYAQRNDALAAASGAVSAGRAVIAAVQEDIGRLAVVDEIRDKALALRGQGCATPALDKEVQQERDATASLDPFASSPHKARRATGAATVVADDRGTAEPIGTSDDIVDDLDRLSTWLKSRRKDYSRLRVQVGRASEELGPMRREFGLGDVEALPDHLLLSIMLMEPGVEGGAPLACKALARAWRTSRGAPAAIASFLLRRCGGRVEKALSYAYSKRGSGLWQTLLPPPGNYEDTAARGAALLRLATALVREAAGVSDATQQRSAPDSMNAAAAAVIRVALAPSVADGGLVAYALQQRPGCLPAADLDRLLLATVASDQVLLAEALLQHGASTRAVLRSGWTPEAALRQGRWRMAEALLRRDGVMPAGEAQRKQLLIAACRCEGASGVVRMVLAAWGSRGQLPAREIVMAALRTAAEAGHTAAVEVLLEDARTRSSASELASMAGGVVADGPRMEAAAMLVRAAGPVGAANTCDVYGGLRLRGTGAPPPAEQARLLFGLFGDLAAYEDASGSALLYHVCLRGVVAPVPPLPELLPALLQRGSWRPGQLAIPLAYAVRTGQAAAVRALLAAPGAAQAPEALAVLLRSAVAAQRLEVAEELRAAGAV